MLPLFANPLGLWALLGVPAILAIHFLQQRAREARTSTWFLIEKLSPDSARGRTWDRLRSSRTLWFQLLAVLLAAWVLAEPRWVRDESAQTVVLVFDASASMEAFRAPALEAAEREMNLTEGLAARTTWVVMTTDPRQPPLYRGTERLAALAAMPRWQPDLGQHDAGPALRIAHGLAGVAGRTLFITDRREKAPPDQRTAGVGRALDNVGWAGASVMRDGSVHTWRALIKNHGATPQRRTWQLEAGGTRSVGQTVEIAPGALLEISARFPEGSDEVLVVLAADEFAADDRLPLVRPKPKPLAVSVDGSDEAAEFFRKIAGGVDGVSVLTGGTAASVRLARIGPDDVLREPRAGIFWPPADQRQQAPLATEPVTPDRDELVDGLNWQGWFGSGVYGYVTRPGDLPLLWQGRYPLVFARPASAAAPPNGYTGRKLLLAFDWATSNASRLPATVLLVRRFLEGERDGQRAPYTANFDCNAPVALAGVPTDGELTLEFRPAAAAAAAASAPAENPLESRVIGPAERSELRAPGRAGLFTLKRGDELLVRGATQFADARQGDFRAAEQFFIAGRGEREAALERNTRPDPFIAAWLALLAALVLATWWTRGSGAPNLPRDSAAPNAPLRAAP